jgi:hypothetical protein
VHPKIIVLKDPRSLRTKRRGDELALKAVSPQLGVGVNFPCGLQK